MASGNSLSATEGRPSSPKPTLAAQVKSEAQTRGFIIAWAFTVVFYFLEYAVRSSPSVMIAGLEVSLQHHSGGDRCDSGRLLLHLLDDELGGWRCPRSLGSETYSSHRGSDFGCWLPIVQRTDSARGQYWAPAAGCRLGIRFHWRCLPGGAWILRALSRYCDWCNAMRRNARRLGWTVCRWAPDGTWVGRSRFLGRDWGSDSSRCGSSVCRDSSGTIGRTHSGGRSWRTFEAVQNRFLKSSVVPLRSRGRASVRTHDDWRHDLGSRSISKGSSTHLPQRGSHCIYGPAWLGCGMPASRLAL